MLKKHFHLCITFRIYLHLMYYLRNFAMERKVNNDGRILETAYNIIEQVNTLLVSAANPSDETSLSIRLSLIKVKCL